MFSLKGRRVRWRISKRTRFISHILALMGFLALFIWGWDLNPSDALVYLLLCIVFLLIIVLIAALFGGILRLVQHYRYPPDDDRDIHS